jgi:putative oxidoreductase
MAAFMQISWLMPLVAVAEILVGVLIIITKYRELCAIIVFPIIIYILLTNIINAPTGLPIALVLLAINLWAIFENREKYLPMVK